MQYEAIFHISTQTDFEDLSAQVFKYQYSNCKVYQDFCNLLDRTPRSVSSIESIPFLPIELFKTHHILASGKSSALSFESSGTTGAQPSTHYVANLDLYKRSFRTAFQHFYGKVNDYVILGLLPSYLERKHSSLVFMVDDLVKASGDQHSGFYLHDLKSLIKKLKYLQERDKKILLIGVSFALLDLAEEGPLQLGNTLVMETGGMKGRRKEMIREELHSHLKSGLGVNSIHSEFGMTELLSQAYSKGEGHFQCPPWMKLLIRDPEDPRSFLREGRTGGVNVIDLANLYSCSFIATQDLGKQLTPDTWEILGRFDHSDIRGCNLMVF